MATTILFAILGFGALAAGILIGRYYVPDDRALKRTARHAASYMRAVNHLLARERDAAIDELRSVVKEDVNDVEPYFALGSLFRARGEWERAIRVHQAIAMREDGNRDVKLRALYALGLDFRAAGMPRRATRAMEDCIAESDAHPGALRALCGLYEEQGRFAEAAAAWRRLDKHGAGRSSRELHLLAAAAQRATAAGDLDSARRLVREAFRAGEDEDEPHLRVATAELAMAAGELDEAAEAVLAALARAPDLSAFLVPLLLDVERQRAAPPERSEVTGPGGRPPEELARRAVALLDSVQPAGGARAHLLLARADLRAGFDPEAALAEVRELAREFPDFLPARVAAARIVLADGDAGEIATELRQLCAADGPLGWATEGSWRCRRCGHREEELFWRCPACRRWGDARREVGRPAVEPAAAGPRERRAVPRGLSGAPEREAEDRSGPLAGDDEPDERAGSFLSGIWRSVRRRGSSSSTER